ncbi:MAG: glutamine-hydrolyzing carbamoyl-phosphate synthase small subunit [Alphaproteobacteria bacterium]|nr:glutamine-hydrolyzing carbamoyl-phosphate synthase small subunit [Alphaproteobacteria bacterium]
MTKVSTPKQPPNATAVIVFADGTVIFGRGFGAETGGKSGSVGEVCFNTAMTGYQETLTDPSYAGQIINFTFPHIGNVGTNDADMETITPAARALVVREDVTEPSSWRNMQHLDAWLKQYNLPGISGVDTRALTRYIRENGAPKGVVCHDPSGKFDLDALIKQASDWPGLKGMDLAKDVSCKESYHWTQKCWTIEDGHTNQDSPTHKVVAVDYGAKLNILRCLANAGFDVTVVPAETTAEEILALKPDGVFLSNGPGDPAATGVYATPMIQGLMEKNMPIFGICLGHQLLAQALGGRTEKMHLGHRGANQPVKDLVTGKVEITSQNHGFAVIADSLPEGVEESHVSLFDGSNEGLRVTGKPVFSVQYHPEASPGPMDSYYLFDRFRAYIEEAA